MQKLEEIYNKINNLFCLLDRKKELLTQVLNITKNQNIVFENNDNDAKSFLDISVKEKQKLINELLQIDEMFINIFESFNGDLNQNKQMFKDDILNLKYKIQQISEIDFKIRLQEEKNKNITTYNKSNQLPKIKTLKMSTQQMLKKYNDNKQI